MAYPARGAMVQYMALQRPSWDVMTSYPGTCVCVTFHIARDVVAILARLWWQQHSVNRESFWRPLWRRYEAFCWMTVLWVACMWEEPALSSRLPESWRTVAITTLPTLTSVGCTSRLLGLVLKSNLGIGNSWRDSSHSSYRRSKHITS